MFCSSQRIVFISGLLVIIPISVASSLLEGCIKPVFVSCPHLLIVKIDMILLFGPSLLALIAVVFVSVYAFKLQLRLKMAVGPTVNLSQLQQHTNPEADVRMEDLEIRDNETETVESLDRVLGGPVEGSSRSRNESERKEDHIEPDIIIRRKNSDPNSFFRLPAVVREVTVPDMTSCFKPLTVIVERIMMLNIVALIWLAMITITLCLRLYLFTKVECEKSILWSLVIVIVVLQIVYVLVVRKKLCKKFNSF